MNNSNKWQPSKYIYRKGKLIASRDEREVGISSRFIADLFASFYDKELRKHAKGKLLDLGCGKAPLYAAYKNYITDNICVDWGKTFHKSEHLDVECNLINHLPFKNAEFDTIILSDVLEHIPQPENLWHEMARILSVGGRILMNVPFIYCLHEKPHDYYRYTEYSLRRFVEISALRLISLEPIGGSPEVLTDILAKNLKFVPIFGKSLSLIVQHISNLFLKTTLGRDISIQSAQTFPLGYFLIAEKGKK